MRFNPQTAPENAFGIVPELKQAGITDYVRPGSIGGITASLLVRYVMATIDRDVVEAMVDKAIAGKPLPDHQHKFPARTGGVAGS